MTGTVDSKDLRTRVAALSYRCTRTQLASDWAGIDAVRHLIEAIADEGGVFIIKWDGERTGPEDTGRYTAAVAQGAMGQDAFRTDSTCIEEAVARAILAYADRAWP